MSLLQKIFAAVWTVVLEHRERSRGADRARVRAPVPLPVRSLSPRAVPSIPAPFREPGREGGELRGVHGSRNWATEGRNCWPRVSVLQVGEAVGDFRDGMSSQMCSSIAAIFIPGRNAVLPVGSQGIMEQ